MILSSIVAMGKNRVIGDQNAMMWNIPSETDHFLNIVGDHYYLLGRKNFEANQEFHLKRKAIILTRNDQYKADVPTFTDIDKAIEFAKSKNEDNLFVLGGAEIYRLAMPLINFLHLSIVDFEGEGQAYFPSHDDYKWKVIEQKRISVSEKTPLAWEYSLLEKEFESL
jgi:dihydrofolate reductase